MLVLMKVDKLETWILLANESVYTQMMMEQQLELRLELMLELRLVWRLVM